MMIAYRKLYLFIFLISIFLLNFDYSYSQEILIRQNPGYSEVLIKVSSNNISTISQGNNSIIISFFYIIDPPFSGEVNDKYINSIISDKNNLIMQFNNDIDYAVFQDNLGTHVIGANKKEISNVLFSFNLSPPLLKKGDIDYENPAYESIIKEANDLVIESKPLDAIALLTNLTNSANITPYYKQEALFMIGNAYMGMGKVDKENYSLAADTMDEFVKNYPGSRRAAQARQISAKAKELEGNTQDAITTYNDIYKVSLDLETKREALMNVARLYESTGQYDEALATYKKYIANFKAGSEAIMPKIGEMYLLLKQNDNAYEFYKDLSPRDMERSLSQNQILQLAELLDDRGEKYKAFNLYEYLSNKDSVAKDRDPSLLAEVNYRIATMYKNFGDTDEYSKQLEGIVKSFPNTDYGRIAAVEYAEQNYPIKTGQQWAQYLSAVFSSPDNNDLWQRADIAIIKAYKHDKNYPQLLGKIDSFIKEYPSSSQIANITLMERDALYDQGNSFQNKGDFQDALNSYSALISEFPKSSPGIKAKQNIDDIYYYQAYDNYTAGNYNGTLGIIENYLIQYNTTSGRWNNLWDDSFYRNLLALKGKVPNRILRLKYRQYISESIPGKYIRQVEDMLFESFNNDWIDAISRKNDVHVVELFNQNYPWLSELKDKEYYNRVKISTALSLISMGLRDKAIELFNNITPMIDENYAVLSYTLCNQPIYDINNLSIDDMGYIIAYSTGCPSEYLVSLFKRYTKAPNISTEALYKLSKSLPPSNMKDSLLAFIYNQLMDSNTTHFANYEEVYLDMGLKAYREQDYQKSLTYLDSYIKSNDRNDEAKSEAIYYLAKSLVNINQPENAVQYYNTLINDMPESIYKSMAKSELENYNWQKNLKK